MRLIDADALKKEIRENDPFGGMNYEWYIDHAPTIAASPWHRVEETVQIFVLPQLRGEDGGGRMNKPTPSEPRKITITEICVYAVDKNGEKHKIDITGFPTIHGTLDCETVTLILDPKEDA